VRRGRREGSAAVGAAEPAEAAEPAGDGSATAVDWDAGVTDADFRHARGLTRRAAITKLQTLQPPRTIAERELALADPLRRPALAQCEAIVGTHGLKGFFPGRAPHGMLGSDGLDLSARVDEQELGLYEKRVGLTMAQRRAQPGLFRFDFSRTADGSFVPECSLWQSIRTISPGGARRWRNTGK
jgi:hypothetical protein